MAIIAIILNSLFLIFIVSFLLCLPTLEFDLKIQNYELVCKFYETYGPEPWDFLQRNVDK